jgi:hypothetical protein
MKCRHCSAVLSVPMIDLGAAPPSNAFNATQNVPELHYPLRVMVCMACGLAQTDITLFRLDHDELFTKDYPYYSGTSASFVEHARRYVEKITQLLNLGPDSLTVEIGCNDGYLLRWVKTPCYGFEPTDTGRVAENIGIRVYRSFFDEYIAKKASVWSGGKGPTGKADLMICNNVLAHVPDINDFVRGFAAMLKDTGIATFEFPHLLNLIRQCQFDTIYHEHYSYLSLTAVVNIFKSNGLSVFDVETIPTHGGSLRVYAQKQGGPQQVTMNVAQMLLQEHELSLPTTYRYMQGRADIIKNELLSFLIGMHDLRKTVVGFGAAAKANTLLNYAGIRSDLISYVVDETPSKQGKFMPGSRIPVLAQFQGVPNYVIVFPWNFRDEIIVKLAYLRASGTRLVFAMPRLEILGSLAEQKAA